MSATTGDAYDRWVSDWWARHRQEAIDASIALQPFDTLRGCYQCGCHQRDERFWMCQYHEGFSDGFDACGEMS